MYGKVPDSEDVSNPKILDVIARTANMDDTFKHNIDSLDADAKWQYFSHRRGVTRVFPGSIVDYLVIFTDARTGFEWDKSCDGSYSSYDARVRP